MEKKIVLVTAGSTRVPIDKVRMIDNVFKGKTGTVIAEYFADQGCDVYLLTSNPDLVKKDHRNLAVVPFSTFDGLFEFMRCMITAVPFGTIIHSAAVSDYRVGGTYQQINGEMVKVDQSGKIGSDYPELWMKMIPTPKIVDRIRDPWGFKGKLVKFKLQVDMDDETLIDIATKSMMHSKADFIVANTLEGSKTKAFIISAAGGDPICVSREELPIWLYKELGL